MPYLAAASIVPLRRLARLSAHPFFTFFLLLYTLDSFKATNHSPSLTIRVPSFYIRFLLCDLYCVVALLAALSLEIRFYANTSLCAIIIAPLVSFLKITTILTSELSIYL